MFFSKVRYAVIHTPGVNTSLIRYVDKKEINNYIQFVDDYSDTTVVFRDRVLVTGLKTYKEADCFMTGFIMGCQTER